MFTNYKRFNLKKFYIYLKSKPILQSFAKVSLTLENYLKWSKISNLIFEFQKTIIPNKDPNKISNYTFHSNTWNFHWKKIGNIYFEDRYYCNNDKYLVTIIMAISIL